MLCMQPIEEASSSSLTDIESYLAIEEASSSSPTDIESYLAKVKQDLKIGATGATVKVAIAGDQQTYALMLQIFFISNI